MTKQQHLLFEVLNSQYSKKNDFNWTPKFIIIENKEVKGFILNNFMIVETKPEPITKNKKIIESYPIFQNSKIIEFEKQLQTSPTQFFKNTFSQIQKHNLKFKVMVENKMITIYKVNDEIRKRKVEIDQGTRY